MSIVLPVRDGGEDLRRCLSGIAQQAIDEPVETVVIDSGSVDDSVAIAKEHGARLDHIPPEQFNHGGTRNRGAELARGDVLVFTSQDAYAADERWLATLVRPLRADPGVAGVYGRQTAHEDATPPERYFHNFLYGPERREQRIRDASELSMETTMFSNANSAIRRSAWEAFRFADKIIMSEDQDWSRRVLLAGWTIVYEPAAVVRHSHPYGIKRGFRRFFDSGVSAERAYLAGARSSSRVLRRAATRYAFGELAWLVRSGQARWIPYAAAYETARFVGLQLGARHRRLPLWLTLRCSGALPEYWQRNPARLRAFPR